MAKKEETKTTINVLDWSLEGFVRDVPDDEETDIENVIEVLGIGKEPRAIQCLAVARALVDASGNRLFSDYEVHTLLRRDENVVKTVYSSLKKLPAALKVKTTGGDNGNTKKTAKGK